MEWLPALVLIVLLYYAGTDLLNRIVQALGADAVDVSGLVTGILVIGVVQGRALGMGCAVAALCDITIACDDARFALTEMANRTLPTIAMSGLIDRVGRKGITYLTYTALEVDAPTALAYGIVSLVVPKADVEAALARLRAAGFLLIVVTNQPDVARGTQRRDVIDAMHASLLASLPLDAVRVCAHDDADCSRCV